MPDVSKFEKLKSSVDKALDNTSLHIHQRDALRSLKDHFMQDERSNYALIVLPTGSGKSGIISLAPYILGAHRVLIITPSIVISKLLYGDMWYFF